MKRMTEILIALSVGCAITGCGTWSSAGKREQQSELVSAVRPARQPLGARWERLGVLQWRGIIGHEVGRNRSEEKVVGRQRSLLIY